MTYRKSYIRVQNNTSEKVLVQLYHKNDLKGMEGKSWIIEANQTTPQTHSDSLIANFRTGHGDDPDGWFVVMHTVSGSHKRTYISRPGGRGSIDDPEYKTCNLESQDDGQYNVFTVNETTFGMNLKENHASTGMSNWRDFQDVQHVFMLMLENRSFDHMLGNSGINGLQCATSSNYNVVNGRRVFFSNNALAHTHEDPRHEFNDVAYQLLGSKTAYQPNESYPAPLGSNDTKFAQDYWDIDPGAVEGLAETLESRTSPSIFGSQVPNVNIQRPGCSVAMSRSGGKLSIIDSGNGNSGLDYSLNENTSPGVTRINGHSKNWIAAFCNSGDRNLRILENNHGGSGNDPVSVETMMDGSSPAITALSDGSSWAATYANDSGKLSFYQSNGTTTNSQYSVGEGSSPSIAALPNGSWVTAALGTDSHVFVTQGSGGDCLSLAHSCKAKNGTNPSIATDLNGNWAFAYVNSEHELRVYESKTGTLHSSRIRAAKYTSPSIASDGRGGWRVALQSCNETHDGVALVLSHHGEFVFAGGKMRSKTSPSLSTRIGGGWQMAYQSSNDQIVLVDDQGDGAQDTPPFDVMTGFDTASQLPCLNQLAQTFLVCDHWYSSMPGPTWPNRFFSLCASSGDLDDSPTSRSIALSQTVWEYDIPTIFQKIKHQTWTSTDGDGGSQALSYRIYHDFKEPPGYTWVVGGAVGAAANSGYSLYSDTPNRGLGMAGLGWIPISLALKGTSWSDCHSMGRFAVDITNPYDEAFTLIEPHYGAVIDDSYKGGSSQHPKDSYYGGEAIIQAVYDSLRNSPLWYTSVLIITYDEHGGFYDSGVPPQATRPSNDTVGKQNSFLFDRLGPRVPALVVSPLLDAGISHTTYDHASIPKTIEDIFNLTALTNRDSHANGLLGQLNRTFSSSDGPRTDCPIRLYKPVSPADVEPRPGVSMDSALPTSGNLVGVMQILLKLAMEHAAPEQRGAILERYEGLKTRADLEKFADEVCGKLYPAEEIQKKESPEYS